MEVFFLEYELGIKKKREGWGNRGVGEIGREVDREIR